MSMKKISEAILGVGVDDTTIDLFESQYPVPTGVSYNSYVILDEKTTILDTVDARATEPWLENLAEALGGRKPAYLVVSHMEPDHGANVAKLAALYPEMQVVGNAKTFQYMEQFFGADAIAPERRVVVKDGESLSLGAHTLTFVFAPMVHWPEVICRNIQNLHDGCKIRNGRRTTTGTVSADRGRRNKHCICQLDIGNILFIHNQTQTVTKIFVFIFIIRFHTNDFIES